MYVFRTYQTKSNPETGKREFVLDSKDRKIPHARWRFEYTDWKGQRRIRTGTASKAETKKLAARVQAQQDEIRDGVRPAPKSCDQHGARPYDEVRDEYLAWGEAQGGRGGRPWAEWHAYKRRTLLTWWGERLGLQTLADLETILPKAEAALREQLKAGNSGKTVMLNAEALRAFCKWCENRGYLENNPVKRMERFDTTPRTRRRAMSAEEIHRLLDAATEERRLTYETALCTGLRAKELRSLRVADLNPDFKSLNLHAEWTKNRKPGLQPLPLQLYKRLKEWARGKAQDAPLLNVPTHIAREMDKDLLAAKIPKSTPEGKLDFHACRVAYISFILESGATVKEGQTLARHSTPDLTFNTYGRTRQERLYALAEKVGELVLNPSEHITGTQREVVGLESGCSLEAFMVEDRGFEPPTSALRTQRSPS